MQRKKNIYKQNSETLPPFLALFISKATTTGLTFKHSSAEKKVMEHSGKHTPVPTFVQSLACINSCSGVAFVLFSVENGL